MAARKMSNFPVTLPVEQHKIFKMHCVAKGVTMADVIRAFVARECAAYNAANASKTKAKPARAIRRTEEVNVV